MSLNKYHPCFLWLSKGSFKDCVQELVILLKLLINQWITKRSTLVLDMWRLLKWIRRRNRKKKEEKEGKNLSRLYVVSYSFIYSNPLLLYDINGKKSSFLYFRKRYYKTISNQIRTKWLISTQTSTLVSRKGRHVFLLIDVFPLRSLYSYGPEICEQP